MKKPVILVFLAIFLTNAFFTNSFAQSATNEIKTLRNLFAKRDYAEGYKLGKEFTSKNSGDPELQYWYAANGSRSPESKKTLEDIEKLVKDKGENTWTLLALAAAQTPLKSAESLMTAEKIIKTASDNQETIFVYNAALFQNKKYSDSLNWLVQNENKTRDKSRFLSAKAISIYFLEKDKKEKAQVQTAFDIFAQAVKAEPLSVNANYLYGSYLNREKKFEEAVPFLGKASELSTKVSSLREAYWRAIKAQTKKTDEEKKAELETAIDSYLKQTDNAPDALVTGWKEYLELMGWRSSANPKYLQKKEQLEKQIIQKFPGTTYDEEIYYTETLRVYSKYLGKNDGAKNLEITNRPQSKRTSEEIKFLEDFEAKNKIYKAERIALERAFLKRPRFFEKERMGEVSLNLLQSLSRDKTATDEEFAALIKNAIENYKSYWGNINTEIASLLLWRRDIAPNSQLAKDAEKYARLGIIEAENKIKVLPKQTASSQVQEMQLEPLNVLAQALISGEKFDEAEKILLQISKMLENADAQNSRIEFAKYNETANWAKLYEAKKDWEKAETYYVKFYRDNDFGRKAFEKLYEKKFGRKEGFDEYYPEIQKKLKFQAKERIAQSRIKNAQDAVPFSLKDLNDKTISFADLKGKIIVINIWGTWCGPCVAEMGELQEFFDKYRDDKDVAILTIDSNDELADVKKFVADRKISIPVMIDDGYIFKTPQFSSNAAYPTTFFIDKAGKMAFVKTGNSGNLVEEFSWRVDLLKEK